MPACVLGKQSPSYNAQQQQAKSTFTGFFEVVAAVEPGGSFGKSSSFSPGAKQGEF
jgi:hypothetical protein